MLVNAFVGLGISEGFLTPGRDADVAATQPSHWVTEAATKGQGPHTSLLPPESQQGPGQSPFGLGGANI